MSKRDKFKAAFLPKKNLARRAGAREQEARGRLHAANRLIDELPDNEADAAGKRLDALHEKVDALATLAADDPGAAWIAFGELAPVIEKEIGLLQLQAREAAAAGDKRVAAQLLAVTREDLAAAQNGCRALSAARKPKTASKFTARAQKLSAKVDQAAAETPPSLDTLRSHRDEARALLKDVRAAGGRPAEPRTQAAASKAVLADLEQIPVFGKHLGSDAKDAQGRTAREDVEQRLAVFDSYYAADTDDDDDPDAGVRNQAMRLAATASVMATRVGAELNDPYLVPRIGQSMVNEYAPEMRASLSRGADSDDDADKSIRLARALVMDDPVGKLMLGKMNPADAVQSIRDMAEAGGVAPSQMLAMLRQQFEMKVASLTLAQVKAGEKKKDTFAKGNFELSEITGELSPSQFTAMFAVDANDDSPPRTDDDSALEFKAAAGQVHATRRGDTFGTLARTYLGDPERWAEIRDLNQVLVQHPDARKGKAAVEQQVDLTGLGRDDALAAGLKLTVPGKLSLLDQLAPYVEAWDEEEDDDGVDAAWERKPRKPKKKKKGSAEVEDDDLASPLSKITPDQLRAGAANLKSPRDLDPKAIQVPGLGQEHQVRAPLGEGGKKASEADKLHGQINERQYAHLRLLARADAEDRDAVLARTGKSVEQHVLDHLKARYGIDDAKAQRIAAGVQAWIAKVPLTITFTADRVFSDAKKNAPAFGEKFKSEVELSRGSEDKKDVVGRAEQGGGTVGTQGGSKTVTGWKERGDNYMRWRRDKDAKEARKDVLGYEDQQIYGAANPTFGQTKGDGGSGDPAAFGTNYYGDAHFLLKDAVRNRCAFIVRTDSGQVNVQRQDVSMLIYDMLAKGSKAGKGGLDAKFMDQLLQIATGATTITMPGMTWEVHLYGGFDSSKDAQAIYLADNVPKAAAERIRKFAKKNGIDCEGIGSAPTGLVIKNNVPPTTIDLSSL